MVLVTWAIYSPFKKKKKNKNKKNLECYKIKMKKKKKKKKEEEEESDSMGLCVIYKYGRSWNKESGERGAGWLGRLAVSLEPFSSWSFVHICPG